MMKLLLVFLFVLYGSHAELALPAFAIRACDRAITDQLEQYPLQPFQANYPNSSYVAVPPDVKVGYNDALLNVTTVNNTYSNALFIPIFFPGFVPVPFPLEADQVTMEYALVRGFPTQDTVVRYYVLFCPHDMILAHNCDPDAIDGTDGVLDTVAGVVDVPGVPVPVNVVVFTIVTNRTCITQSEFEDCADIARQIYPRVEFSTLSIVRDNCSSN